MLGLGQGAGELGYKQLLILGLTWTLDPLKVIQSPWVGFRGLGELRKKGCGKLSEKKRGRRNPQYKFSPNTKPL